MVTRAKPKRANSLETVRAADRQRLERAMCTIIDYEGPITDALTKRGVNRSALGDICNALRLIVDGD